MAVTITCQMFLYGAIFQSNCLNSNSKYLAKQNYYLTLSAHKLHKLELSCGLVSKLNDFLESAWQSINIQQIKGPFKAFSTHLLTVHSQTVQASKSCNKRSLFNVTCQQCILEGLKMG